MNWLKTIFQNPFKKSTVIEGGASQGMSAAKVGHFMGVQNPEEVKKIWADNPDKVVFCSYTDMSQLERTYDKKIMVSIGNSFFGMDSNINQRSNQN